MIMQSWLDRLSRNLGIREFGMEFFLGENKDVLTVYHTEKFTRA